MPNFDISQILGGQSIANLMERPEFQQTLNMVLGEQQTQGSDFQAFLNDFKNNTSAQSELQDMFKGDNFLSNIAQSLGPTSNGADNPLANMIQNINSNPAMKKSMDDMMQNFDLNGMMNNVMQGGGGMDQMMKDMMNRASKREP